MQTNGKILGHIVAYFVLIVPSNSQAQDTKSESMQNIATRCAQEAYGRGYNDFVFESCRRRQTEIFKKGKPSFATHTPDQIYKLSAKDKERTISEKSKDIISRECRIAMKIPLIVMQAKSNKTPPKNLLTVADKRASSSMSDMIGSIILREATINIYEKEMDIVEATKSAKETCVSLYQAVIN